MKFDVVIQNPPYNPNSLWKKFVLRCIDLLNDNGQMVVIHPYGWRDSSTHKKLFNHLIQHISELHITDFNSFPGIGIKTDWYVYNKIKQDKCKIIYSNKETEVLNLDSKDRITRLHTNSIENKVASKILTSVDNGVLFEKGFNDAYKNNSETGKYKQCGGPKKGTKWITGDFLLTDEPTKHQFDDKIVISYAGKPRAKHFNDDTGVCVANYWLIDSLNSNPDSVCMVLNSNMFWKTARSLMDGENIIITRKIPAWILRAIDLNNLHFKSEEEMYEHYGLTEEEIAWVES